MKRIAAGFAFVVFAPLALACKREAPPVTQEARAPTAGAVAADEPRSPPAGADAPATLPGTDAPSEATAGKNRYEEGKFVLSIEPNGEYAAGKQGVVNVVLNAVAPFHVNQQYPYKFKTKEAPGVKYPAAVVTKDQAKLEAQRVTMPVAFSAEKAGKTTVAGQFAFSVCTEETCLMEKRDLALALDVK